VAAVAAIQTQTGRGGRVARVMTDDELEAAFIEQFGSGNIDKIRYSLAFRYPGVPKEEVDAAVQEACLAVVRRQKNGEDTSNVGGLVRQIARNKLFDLVAAAQQAQDSQYAVHLRQGPEWGHHEEYEAGVERGIKYVRDIATGWDIDNYRRTILLLLDAAADGVFLMPKEIAEALGCSVSSAAKWREAGYARLRVQLAADSVMTMNELFELLPLAEEPDDETDDDEDETDD
jgi:DNA-directed RNA polymerase specialized sigma24 family protein